MTIRHHLLPNVLMESLVRDVSKAIGCVGKNIRNVDGEPDRILLGGHPLGAQFTMLLCFDPSDAGAEGGSLKNIIDCIPVDGDTLRFPQSTM